MASNPQHDIRIGTLVPGHKDPAGYIRQILPHGFESFSITFGGTTQGVKWKKLADEIKQVLDGSGAVISSLGVYGNPLEKLPKDKATLKGWRECIDHAHLFGCDIVAGFTGRIRNEPIEKSIGAYKRVFGPLARQARDKGVRLAFENCEMGGDWQSGDWNIAHTPAAWELMFDALPDRNIGLQWEPCHQMVKLIDPLPQIREWGSRFFNIHGKDATILWDVIKRFGIKGNKKWAYHRTPGFGDSNWTDIITLLRLFNFKGSIDIEGWHDPIYRDKLEMTGQVHGLNYLKQCRGGAFVPNPK